jgi:hypothetical protein
MKQTYVKKNGQQLGPFDDQAIFSMLKQGIINYSDLCWRHGWDDWKAIEVIYPKKKNASKELVRLNLPSVDWNLMPRLSSVKGIFLLIIIGLGAYYTITQGAIEQKRLTAKENQKPKISEIFKTQLIQFIENGSELDSKTTLGINVVQLSDYTSRLKGSLEILEMSWPESFCPNAIPFFKNSIKGYELALEMFKKEHTGGFGTPPDERKFHFENDDDFISQSMEYEGKYFHYRLWNDNKAATPQNICGSGIECKENVSALFTIAGTYFKIARKIVMQQLSN